VLAEAATLPERMCVTESWPPNADLARRQLAPRGVEVHATEAAADLPFPDQSFDLVSSRHPIAPFWEEIHRALVPRGIYFAQHVGLGSAIELIEFFLGPMPRERQGREPTIEAAAAEEAGLTVIDLRTAGCRMEFFDVGAVVWTLRKCVWWDQTSLLSDTTTSSSSSMPASAAMERLLRTQLDISSKLSARAVRTCRCQRSHLPTNGCVIPARVDVHRHPGG
jgi:SAM-dependent methyltransferase